MTKDQRDDQQGKTPPEEKSEVARLFHQALTEHMSDEDANVYLSDMLDEERINERIFERIHLASETEKQLLVTSYQPDQAVREASLARAEQWQAKDSGEVAYTASNEFEVYFGAPVEISEAISKIRKLNESTVLTARITLGLWNSRRYNQQVTREGSVAILLDEILQWQGIQKHSRTAHPGITKRYTDGYRIEQKRRVMQDLALLAACQVRGTCKLIIRGKSTVIRVDGPYLRYDTVSRQGPAGEEIILGFLVAPGGWIGTYEQGQNETLAQIDQLIFTLNPQNDRYALRLALYLTERWREQAKSGQFSEPLTMTDLLASSMIDVDMKNLNKQAPAIEKALSQLESMGILGRQLCLEGFHIGVKKVEDEWETNTCMKIHQASHSENPCREALDKVVPRWSKEWLAAKWEILPPLTLIHAYAGLKKPRRKRVRKLPDSKE